MVSTSTPPSQGECVCVFDLDGTLADTAPDLIAALNHVLRSNGLRPAGFEEARGFVGHGARVLIERAYRAQKVPLDEEQAVQRVGQFIAFYRQNIANDTRLFPNVLRALDTMRSDGWRFAICTNKPEALAVQLVTELGVLERFAAITGGDSFPFRKPDGRHILETIAKAGGDPSRAIMVGDSAPDIGAARDANVPVVGVSFGYFTGTSDELGADRLIDDFAQLPDAVAALMGV
ncbi:MAG: phosphoglycolate phosphatase [Pseudomonadota bacterium]